jgi:DNA-binding NarL/FixJ family response regulator
VIAYEREPSVTRSRLIRVLVAEPHYYLRQGLIFFLETCADMTLVGEAEDGQQVIDLCRELQPDVVLMDLAMPVVDGITTTAKIRSDFPHTGVVVLADYNGNGQVQAVLEAGASRCLIKDGPIENIANAIRTAVG